MKKVVLKILRCMCKFLSIFLNSKVLNINHFIIDNVQWNAYKKKFNEVGGKCFIYSPFFVKGAKYIKIGDNFRSNHDLTIEAYGYHNGNSYNPQIIIGNNVTFNSYCHIGCIDKIEIDDNVLFASKIFITDHTHGRTSIDDIVIPPNERALFSKGPVHIKKNVWIGENVVIMPGVTIGQNSIIGANSVVTIDIPQNCVAAGAPARFIKTIK